MKKIALFIALIIALSASAQRRYRTSRRDRLEKQEEMVEKTYYQHYVDSLQQLINHYKEKDSIARTTAHSVTMNPYFMPLLATGTVFNSPLHQQFGIRWSPSIRTKTPFTPTLDSLADHQLTKATAINDQLSKMYIKTPSLFTQTEKQLHEKGALLENMDAPLKSNTTISDQIELVDIEHDVTDPVAAITRRPNFWTFKGSLSLQFTQAHFSENWFQGGDNNYSALGLVTLEANFDNKQKVQWENKLEAQLGFQTTSGDTCHSLKVTSNLLRFTTKFGYKATSHWYYTTQFQTYTQIYPNFKTNSKDEVTTDFASPLYMSLSIGMDYKLNKKRFTGSLYLSPLSVNARYVDRPELRSRYNDSEDQVTKWTWGPNITINYTWKVIDNISWLSRFYWFSNFEYTNIEWENTFTFTINKYLNCKLFVYPKFLDNNTNYKNSNGRYWMFKEWLSLGVSYSW